MKKKIFVGLLSCALVCLAFVFTNASSDSIHVSGKVKIYQDGMQVRLPVSIDVTSENSSNSFSTVTSSNGSFDLTLHHNDEVRYSYSDNNGSVSETRVYSSDSESESVSLYYISGQHRQQ